MADTKISTAKRLTRGALFGEECRIRHVYGCSPLAAKIWCAYARAVGAMCPPVASMLTKALTLGRRPFDNLHGEQIRRREFTYGQRLVREAQAREERGEQFALLRRQA